MVNKLVAAAGIDPAAEREGQWVEYSRGGSTFKVKLARAGTGNAEFMKLQNRLLKPWRAGARNGQPAEIPHEADRKIMRELYASAIVLDWDVNDFGQEFSKQNVIDTFTDLNDFLDWVINVSNDADTYAKRQLEEAAGN